MAHLLSLFLALILARHKRIMDGLGHGLVVRTVIVVFVSPSLAVKIIGRNRSQADK